MHGRPYDNWDDASEYWLREEADDCEEDEKDEDRKEDVGELENELNDEREELLFDNELLIREDMEDAPHTTLQAA